MKEKDDPRSKESVAKRIPIRFFSRKHEDPEENASPSVRPLESLSDAEYLEAQHDQDGFKELDRTIDESSARTLEADESQTGPTPGRDPDPGAETAALQDRILRVAAEFDNFRKRTERERAAELERARGQIVEGLLPIIDNFQRALQTARMEDASSNLVSGLELIARQLDELLNGFKVRPLESVGQAFDPSLHEAVATSPRLDLPENTIVEEYQRGYLIGDRLLRPARVKVVTR